MLNLDKKLPRNFYTRDVHIVARKLLGKIFVRIINGNVLAGRIVEVEAYDGQNDMAAHSFIGKTKRNEVMFNGGGNLYVYFTYGMHFCSNVVTGKLNSGCAVLLRAIEPIAGIDAMSLNRFGKKIITEREKINLCSGPAKICMAFAINKENNGTELNGDEIFILGAPTVEHGDIISTTRIGIKKSVDLPWRYYIKNNPYVSKK